MSKNKLGFLVLVPLLILLGSSGFLKSESNFHFDFINKSKGLEEIVQRNLQGKDGKYAVYIEELNPSANGDPEVYQRSWQDSPEAYGLNAKEVFPAASLYKLYLMVEVLKEVDIGRLKMEDGVSASKEHLISVLGEDEYGINDLPDTLELSVDEALTRVGRISDNFSAVMLSEKVGWDKVQEMADSLEAKNTKVQDPITTTAQDTALFFKKLYLKQIVNEKVSSDIVRYLSLNQINDRIPVGGGNVTHKTGELAGIRHDGGIVYLGSKGDAFRAYVIVLMSKDLQYEDEGVETLAKISKDVYEYFKNK